MRRIWTHPRILQLPFPPRYIVRQPPASSLIPTIMRQIWTHPRILQLRFPPRCCIVRQPPASSLIPTIMRRIWTHPRILQLPFPPRCIIRQPPASSLIPTLFFKDPEAKGSLVICRPSTFSTKSRTSLEPRGNSEEEKDTRPLRDCEDVWRSNSAKLIKEWQPIHASIGSNPKPVEPTSNQAYADNVDDGCTAGERSLKDSGRRERPQGIKSGSTNQTQGNNKNGDRKGVEFPIRETGSIQEAHVGKDGSFIQVLRRNGDNHHKEEANPVLKLIKYINDNPVAIVGFLSTVASAILVYICQQYWSETHQFSVYESRRSLRETAIYQKLIDGPSFDDKDRIPRKVLQDEVRSLLTPSSTGRLYPLVIGQHAVGKTTLIQLAVNALPSPKGVIYFDVPMGDVSPAPFIAALQNSIGWSPDPMLDASKSALDLSDLWKAFFAAASKFKKEFGVIPVIIIDNANRLAIKQPELLEMLQDHAKNAADSDSATFMFVSSEGLVPRRMMKRSAWSRHGEILEVGDITEEEALDYLRSKGVEVETAKKAHNLVGGRIVHLRLIADALNAGRNFDGIKRKLLRDASAHVQDAEIMPGARYHYEGSQIIKALLKGKRLTEEQYYKKLGFHTGYSLLEKSVFALHVESGVVTFQSRLIERYCESQQGSW